MEIDKKLYEDIKAYCKLNNLKISDFVNAILRKAFNIEKYGDVPPIFNKKIQNDMPINNKKDDEYKDDIHVDENNEDIIDNKNIVSNNLIKNDNEQLKLVIKEKKKRKLN